MHIVDKQNYIETCWHLVFSRFPKVFFSFLYKLLLFMYSSLHFMPKKYEDVTRFNKGLYYFVTTSGSKCEADYKMVLIWY